MKRVAYELFLICIGCIFMAMGTSFFLLPNQLSSGGFAGIATVIYYFLGLPLGTVMFILNIPLFIASYFRIGKIFVLKSILGTFLLSYFIDLFDKFTVSATEDKFLACVYGGILIGIGMAIILKANASTGGTDLTSYIIKSFKPFYRQGTLIVIIDVVIVGINVIFFNDIEVGLYSAIAIYLMGKMIDVIFEGVYFTKVMFIISDKYEEIAKQIGMKVNRGSTGIYAKGMYSKNKKMMLICVGTRNEIVQFKQIALKIDNKAFMIVFNAREALGKGFKKEEQI